VASNFHDQRLKVAVPAIGLRGLSLNASLIGNGEGAMRFSSFYLLASSFILSFLLALHFYSRHTSDPFPKGMSSGSLFS
jgi:hypothetical protein